MADEEDYGKPSVKRSNNSETTPKRREKVLLEVLCEDNVIDGAVHDMRRNTSDAYRHDYYACQPSETASGRC
ncbi:hypothetical protein HPB48_013662 [Haemaphysalis longicornis]|uniref:Uncharacterized protein n=1 Tax=Haemaphysalis longicornis TaxID=44386 RepID=A0A9J6FBL9_HAELO|nr:hypothetical protein HPB48_013662 [Haemaphysalis longicornis]